MPALSDTLAELSRAHPPAYALVTVGSLWLAGAAAAGLAVRLLDLLTGGPGPGRGAG